MTAPWTDWLARIRAVGLAHLERYHWWPERAFWARAVPAVAVALLWLGFLAFGLRGNAVLAAGLICMGAWFVGWHRLDPMGPGDPDLPLATRRLRLWLARGWRALRAGKRARLAVLLRLPGVSQSHAAVLVRGCARVTLLVVPVFLWIWLIREVSWWSSFSVDLSQTAVGTGQVALPGWMGGTVALPEWLRFEKIGLGPGETWLWELRRRDMPGFVWWLLFVAGLVWLTLVAGKVLAVSRDVSAQQENTLPRRLAGVAVPLLLMAGLIVLPMPALLGWVLLIGLLGWFVAALAAGDGAAASATRGASKTGAGLLGVAVFVLLVLGAVYNAFIRLFITRHAGVTLLTLFILLLLSFLLGEVAYRNIQANHQNRMFRAVAEADVIADYCNGRSDISWNACASAERRTPLPDHLVWAMLASAEVIDPLNVATPRLLEDLKGSDPAAAVVVDWLKGEWNDRKPENLKGVDLLLASTSICIGSATSSGDDPEAYLAGERAIVAGFLADLYPTPGTDDWLNREFTVALGPFGQRMTEMREQWRKQWQGYRDQAGLGGRLFALGEDLNGLSALWQRQIAMLTGSPASETGEIRWLTPPSPRDIVASPKMRDYIRERASVWQDADGLGRFAAATSDRKSIPRGVGDEDIVAWLMANGGFMNDAGRGYRTSFDGCPDDMTALLGITEQPVKFNAVKNFERFAMFVAGQIRTSPEVKSARFWLSIYTGHEQRLILIFAIFGILLVGLRILVFLQGTILSLFSHRFARLTLFDTHPPTLQDRDNDFDGLASSRWAKRLVVAVLPAIGFVGTVRGIMLSLNGADAIVWAETVNERSSAISALSADLGLAFATTLLALLAGGVLTVLTAVEMALGERLLIVKYSRLTKLEEQAKRKEAADG